MIRSFFGSMQIELLDRRIWTTDRGWHQRSSNYIRAFYSQCAATAPW